MTALDKTQHTCTKKKNLHIIGQGINCIEVQCMPCYDLYMDRGDMTKVSPRTLGY